jgi:hypothetical protein
MTLPLGHASIGGFKMHSNAWGSGAPVALGASDGFEFDSESIRANSARIKSEGNYGNAYRRAGAFAALKPGGSVPMDLYYRCASWRLVALAMGADAVTALGGGAHRHDISCVNNHTGKHGTLVFPLQNGAGAVEGVKEIPHTKVEGFTLEWTREQAGKLSIDVIGFDDYLNIGAPSVAFVVASVAVGTGAQTVLAAALTDFTPSPLTFTKAGTVTAINVTIVYVDRFNVQKSITFTETDFVANLWTGLDYARRVISVTINTFTGSGNISAGVSNGVNNQSTVSAITTVTERDKVLFSQLRFFANAQGGADFVAADEYFLEALRISLKVGFDQRVTTEFGTRISEPSTGAAARPEVMVSLNYSALTTQNKNKFFDMIAKNQIKAKAIFTGPTVPASSPAVAQTLTIWLNALQVDEGEGTVGGPGVLGFEQSLEAQQAIAVPTGFPSGVDEPLFMQLVNNLATAII